MAKIRLKKSQLDAMSQEELAELAIQLQKLEQASQHRRQETYLETANLNQHAFHRADKRIRMFFGSNRSGKTTAGVNEVIWTAMGTHPFRSCPVPSKGLVVGQDFQNHINNVLMPKFTQWTPPGAITRIDKNQAGAWSKVRWASGTTMDVMSCDQELKSFEGGDYDWVYIDEPVPYKIFTAIWRGLTDRGGMCWITCTPLTAPWLYREYRKALAGDPLMWFIFAKMTDNAKNIGEGDERLGLKRIEEFTAMLDPEEKAARLEGQFIQMAGQIFKSWDPKHHLIKQFPWPNLWPIVESIDPHPRKDWAVSWIGLTPSNNRILIRASKFPGDIEEVGAQILEARAQLGIEGSHRPRIVRCLIDNYASAPVMTKPAFAPRTTERLTILDLVEAMIGRSSGGPRVEVAPKDVHQKIEIFKRWLRIGSTPMGPRSRFYAFDNYENTAFIDEIENYVWDRFKTNSTGDYKDQPVKKNDDILDTIMQVCLTLKEPSEEQEEIQASKGISTYGSRTATAFGR